MNFTHKPGKPQILHSTLSAMLAAMSPLAPAAAQNISLSGPAAEKALTPPESERQLSWSLADRETLDRALGDRVRHGLDRVPFLPETQDADQAAIDMAYTRAALRYADALAGGVVDPALLHDVYTVDRPKLHADITTLSDALNRGSLSTWLDGLAPHDSAYAALSDAYLAATRQKGSIRPEIEVVANLHVGDSNPDVGSIVAYLANNGYLDPSAIDELAGAYTLYSPSIAQAIKALQRDTGIRADGIVGPETAAILNAQPEDRIRALAVALERRRWLSRTPPATRIDVNIAAAELRYFRDGVVIDQRKVVVGKADRTTPMLSSPIFRLVANPTWTVPKSIQTTELANVSVPYLEAHNMVMRDGWIVQQPGPENALGLVKFDMVNDHAIYLHDTNAPSLFDRDERHLSHGCVRVADALGFAAMLAEEEGVGDQWQQARESGIYTLVDLPRRIPVRLLYQNVSVNDAGEVIIRTDPYGWNPAVAKALGFSEGPVPEIDAETVDVGP
jgi:murein L,D-transpeptidase YcbB/YkuD